MEEELGPVLEQERHAMAVTVSGGGISLPQPERRVARLAVRELHAVRVIGAPGGGRGAEEDVVGHGLGRGHERLEHGRRLRTHRRAADATRGVRCCQANARQRGRDYAPLDRRDIQGDAMRFLLFAVIIVSAALIGAPADAHVVQAVGSFSITDIDVHDDPQMEQALKTAVNKVLNDTIAFTPTFVALTDAQVIGKRLYFRVLIADEDGERTLTELNGKGNAREVDRPSKVRTTL